MNSSDQTTKVAPTEPEAPELKKTPLNATHRALKAKMVDFGGWDMPVEYPCPGGGLIAEHLAVRNAVGLFDVSHMGEIQFRGPGSLAAVQHITMNDASRLKDGQAHYSALLTPQGTFVDDILVHRLSPNDYLLVVNAGTKDGDYAWIRRQVGSFRRSTSPTIRPTIRSSPCKGQRRSQPCKNSPRPTCRRSKTTGLPSEPSPVCRM
jgi:glycine cleavage system aminomethyltransferase T